MYQLFAGSDSYYIRGYECKSDGEFARILQDDIRFHGAPNRIVSDRAKAEISNKVKEILRKYHIDAHQSEPYQQQQNPINVLCRMSSAMPTMSTITVMLHLNLGYLSFIMSLTS